jgi:inorganic pyrophosphatase
MQHLVPSRFWTLADELVASSEVVIDRPKGSRHPRLGDRVIYPFDYGFLRNTKAMDGGEIDVWRGSLPEPQVTGVIATVDIFKRDSEIKLLVGCTEEEARIALTHHNNEWQSALLILRNGSTTQES